MSIVTMIEVIVVVVVVILFLHSSWYILGDYWLLANIFVGSFTVFNYHLRTIREVQCSKFEISMGQTLYAFHSTWKPIELPRIVKFSISHNAWRFMESKHTIVTLTMEKKLPWDPKSLPSSLWRALVDNTHSSTFSLEVLPSTSTTSMPIFKSRKQTGSFSIIFHDIWPIAEIV